MAGEAEDQGAPILPPHPDLTKPPKTAPPPAAPADLGDPGRTIPITLAELQGYMGLQTQIDQIKAEKQAEVDRKETERIHALADAGNSKDALKAQETLWKKRNDDAEAKLAAMEQRWADEKMEVALATAIAGRQLRGDDDQERMIAAGYVKTILRTEFETVRAADGSVSVRHKASGRPAAEVLPERLSSKELSLFFASKARGGSGTDGTRPPANQDNGGNKDLVDQLNDQMKERTSAYPAMGLKAVS